VYADRCDRNDWADIRRNGADTMAAALLTNTPQNVVTPDMF
jgi:hypothetical protein